MIKTINRDPTFLAQKSVPATSADQQVLQDLNDTLQAHAADCVGMAANMIGVNKQIIVCQMGPLVLPLVNPKITQKSGSYQASESCLSLSGERPAKRYKKITVQYLDQHFQPQIRQFTDFVAQIIQHEMDHCQGILI